MIIKYESKNKLKKFCNLQSGDTFEYNECIFLKINSDYTLFHKGSHYCSNTFNALRLSSGSLVMIPLEQDVIILDAELNVIE
jgi:hypothetical protein